MALSDADRALLILSEYRKVVVKDSLVKATNDAAGEININTSLDEAAATSLANKIAAENKHPRVFPIEIEGIMWLDFFAGGPPLWDVVLPHDAVDEPMKGISIKCSFADGTSKIEVRG